VVHGQQRGPKSLGGGGTTSGLFRGNIILSRGKERRGEGVGDKKRDQVGAGRGVGSFILIRGGLQEAA